MSRKINLGEEFFIMAQELISRKINAEVDYPLENNQLQKV